MSIDLSKQEPFDAGLKQYNKWKWNFTGNLSGANNRVMICFIKESNETILDSS